MAEPAIQSFLDEVNELQQPLRQLHSTSNRARS